MILIHIGEHLQDLNDNIFITMPEAAHQTIESLTYKTSVYLAPERQSQLQIINTHPTWNI
jgi:hypothetical protein